MTEGHMHGPSDEQLARYLSAECSFDDRLFIEEWMARHPTRHALMTRMAAIWDEPRFSLDRWDSDDLLRRFGQRRDADVLSQAETHARAQDTPRHRMGKFTSTALGTRSYLQMGGWATALVAIAGFAIWGSNQQMRSAEPDASSETQWTHLTTTGQRATVTLSDGTVATLGPDSRIRTYNRSDGSSRLVAVQGAVYFKIAQDTQSPFIISVNGTSIRVLGTAFGIRRYTTDQYTEIAVNEGKISVAVPDATDATLMAQGDVLRIHQDGHVALVHDAANATAITGWTSGKLVFREKPFHHVVDDLARWFGLNITIADASLKDRVINATFVNEGDGSILRSLAEAVGARIERADRNVTIFAR